MQISTDNGKSWKEIEVTPAPPSFYWSSSIPKKKAINVVKRLAAKRIISAALSS
jgi:hypothetical protein